MTAKATIPTADAGAFPGSTAPQSVIASSYTAPDGSVYVHHDLVQVVKPWEVEAHVGPIKAAEKFGDVESWVAYVKRYAQQVEPGVDILYGPLLTWNAAGLRAVLDYHGADGDPGRTQWTATCPFVLSPEWRDWMRIAGGQPIAHKAAVEALEDLAADVVSPPAADLAALLRNLRATVNAEAISELRADGTSFVSFTKDKRANLPGLDLPPEFSIAVRALVGHADANGAPVRYKLPVKVRVQVGDDAKLAFRFSIPTAERVLEDVYADRVSTAKALLGDGYTLLRAAD